MSVLDELPLRRGSGRVLMLGTVVLAVAAAAVLAAGAQDARLLRLGLVAALWAALLGAFAAARKRREINSDASQVDELRTVYQLELEREVAARREHTLTVERELREQTEQTEIAALRAELAAMRANLEKLMSRDPLVERVALRAESACLLPMPAYPPRIDTNPSFDVRCGPTAALGATAKATRSFTAAGSSGRPPGGTGSALLGSPGLPGPLEEQFRADRSPVYSALPTSDWPVNGRSETALTGCEDSELRFGPGRRYQHELDTHVRSPVEPASSLDRLWNPAVSSTQVQESAPTCWDDGISRLQGSSRDNGRHGASCRESPGSHNNGSHNNGHGRRAAQETPAIGAQRSVNDLLAAHGVASPPRRRRSRDDGPQA
ncbi:MAG: DUF6779 domain-containing protein [Pseudonocardiaceae bacterium]